MDDHTPGRITDSVPDPSLVKAIECLLFDMNGTLRITETHEPTQQAAFEKLRALLQLESISAGFWADLNSRQKEYGRWAQERLVQLDEKEIWTHWLLPKSPAEKIAPLAAELTLAWSMRKGRKVPIPQAAQVLSSLKARGYRLGLISNTWSTLDIPLFLETHGWESLFDVVILSCREGIRKPSPEIFNRAVGKLGITPAQCAYIGNRAFKDISGCKAAGFGLGIIIRSPKNGVFDEENAILPDIVLNSLSDLLKIFPGRENAVMESGDL